MGSSDDDRLGNTPSDDDYDDRGPGSIERWAKGDSNTLLHYNYQRPVQQDRVMLFGHPVMAVKLDDGAIAAVFTDLCNAIGLARAPQARRIRSDDTLSGQLYDIEMDPDGSGIRKVDILTAWAIPTWLTGIQTSRVSPDKREAILAFKREAADALYRHFSQLQQLALPPSQEVLPTHHVPSRPIEPVPPPAQDASHDVWIQYYQQMIAFREALMDMEAWRGEVEARIESVEEVTRLVPEILERLGPATLTPEHQRSVQAYADHLVKLTRATHAAIYGELKDAFHVGTYKDIPDNQWTEVAQWFTSRIRKAEKRQ